MTKRISKAIITVSSITLFFAMIVIVLSSYNYFTTIQKENQRDNLNMVSVGVTECGLEYLEDLDTNKYRITWINSDGVVLFDSKADKDNMENHANREEVIEALENGTGDGKRISDTLSEETLYIAKRLEDNTVIRVSITQRSIISLIIDTMNIFIIIAICGIIFSIFLASKVAKKTVEPINSLNLDEPLSCDVYDEITPLLHRIDKQNKKISAQFKALKEQKEEISVITENVTDGIIILNEKGQVLSSNNVAKSIFPRVEESYYLNFFRDLEYETLIENALKGEGGNIKVEINGEKFFFSASPTNPKGDKFSVFLFMHNITEEENALELRRQFSANVSHELKTPLTSILGASELISSGIVKSDDIIPFAKNIHCEASRLLTLVQDIIKLSRFDEQSKFEFEIVDLKAVTEEMLSHLNEKAAEKNISVDLSLESAKVSAVPTVLFEMLYNLFDNAIIYNKSGGEIVITMEKSENSSKIIWRIKDSGIGIDKINLPHIFERFYRFDKSHSKETGGTGLGLSIVKNGANLHGAKLGVESVVGKGTEISLEFEIK